MYREAVKTLLDKGESTMLISIRDLTNFSTLLCDIITTQYYRHEPVLNEALTSFVVERAEQFMQEEKPGSTFDPHRKYFVAFSEVFSEDLRSLKCSVLGCLKSLKGTVTRTTEVRPELVVGVFRCKACDQLSAKVPQQFKYTEPKKCRTTNCDSNKFDLEVGLSEFTDYQKIRVQEDPMSIPPGSMPRSMDIILRNDTVEKAQPGDLCHFVGQLAVLPDVVSMLKPGDRTQVLMKNTEGRGNAVGM